MKEVNRIERIESGEEQRKERGLGMRSRALTRKSNSGKKNSERNPNPNQTLILILSGPTCQAPIVMSVLHHLLDCIYVVYSSRFDLRAQD